MSYKLMPAPSPPMYALPTSSHARRGIFATRNLWVTAHADEECYPAGFHPLQAQGADGLEQWTQQVSCCMAAGAAAGTVCRMSQPSPALGAGWQAAWALHCHMQMASYTHDSTQAPPCRP